MSSSWVVASASQTTIELVRQRLEKAAIDVATIHDAAEPWTDERHSLLRAVRR
jgi:hypothetical protein